jgi:hypothetical protein
MDLGAVSLAMFTKKKCKNPKNCLKWTRILKKIQQIGELTRTNLGGSTKDNSQHLM